MRHKSPTFDRTSKRFLLSMCFGISCQFPLDESYMRTSRFGTIEIDRTAWFWAFTLVVISGFTGIWFCRLVSFGTGSGRKLTCNQRISCLEAKLQHSCLALKGHVTEHLLGQFFGGYCALHCQSLIVYSPFGLLFLSAILHLRATISSPEIHLLIVTSRLIFFLFKQTCSHLWSS